MINKKKLESLKKEFELLLNEFVEEKSLSRMYEMKDELSKLDTEIKAFSFNNTKENQKKICPTCKQEINYDK